MDDSREVIELINKLQSWQAKTGCKIDIQLPRIVVVGAQSSGKSSVLDGLIGDSILPRGSGTVTKCPIIVQLVNTPNTDDAGIEIDDATDLGLTKDSDAIRKRIADEMESDDGGIKDKPIIVRVYSRNVVTLTVVDLPGIKKMASSGERDDIGDLIEAMSWRHINDDNAIILAVSPANYDISNSDGIRLAKGADPEGNRTIGVLTKLDLMDEGTDARSLLTGNSKDVNVKLGMIGLVNRSQKDINENVSVQDQLKKEKNFLRETYPDLATSNGVPYLRKRLQELLVRHILKCLPGILSEMRELLRKCESRIDAIPKVVTPQEKFRYVSWKIKSFESQMKRELEGSSRNPDYEHLYGGIKIKDIFESEFAKQMDVAARRTIVMISDKKIVTAFRNSGSFDTFFLYPEAVFKKLAQAQVKEIEDPAIKCAESVHEEIVKIADRYLQTQRDAFRLFPEFKRSIREVVHKMLDTKLDDIKRQIKDYIRIQSSVVFSLDSSFNDKLSKLRRKLEKNLHGQQDDSENEDVGRSDGLSSSIAKLPKYQQYAPRMLFMDKLKDTGTISLIKQMVSLYFDHIKKQIQDYIPKLVTDRLIRQFSIEDDDCGANGGLGEELRVHVMDKYEELANLPDYINGQREADVKLKKELEDKIREIKALLCGKDSNDDDELEFTEDEQDYNTAVTY